ncbi:DUF3300 domain-containing protein [Kaistia sp. MMO-174]|uniref:DUF3300 domain-containing protein n=1 Tax=Kaistia sp. MMO-174 TaxID=3081256 RepID=UPI003019483C
MLARSSGAGLRAIGFILLAATSLATTTISVRAAETPTTQAPAPESPAPAQPAPAAAAPAEAPSDEAAPSDVFTQDELRKLLAPIALYPDALLAQLLPACAYPVDIVQASRWIGKNKAAVAKGDFSGADTQGWDPTVKALVRFPDIIAKLNDDLDMTTDLGDAFVSQPDDVAAMIQTLRLEAQKAGSLKTTKEQKVTVQEQGGNQYVAIEPADPGVIYVPTYDPATVYYDNGGALAAGVIGFGTAVAVGIAIDNAWDWGHGWVYPPRWPGYPGYRPGGGNNINIGNDINIGGGMRPWRPDGDRYRPGQGSKPGLANRPHGPGGGNHPGVGNRPGLDRPNAGNRPDIGNRPNAGNRPDRPDRPAVANKGQRPAGGANKAVKKPAKDTAFSNAKVGGKGSKAISNRGASSRKSPPRPQAHSGGGRPQQMHRGGGGRPQMHRGGGGGRQMHRGGRGRH